MRIVVVGPAARRERLRRQLPDDFEVVAEVTTLSEARRLPEVDGYIVCPDVRLRLGRPADTDDDVAMEALTARELEVLAHLADGLSNKAIAARLGISDETVKFHLSAIFGKLGASNRTDAVRQALRKGMVEL